MMYTSVGKEHDLSAFHADFSLPTTIKAEVKDKDVTVSVNGKTIYSLSYHETMGKVVGLRFKFLGLGEVLSHNLYGDK